MILIDVSLPVDDQITIAVTKAKKTTTKNRKVSKQNLTQYSSTAAQYFADPANPAVFTIENAETGDVDEILTWVEKSSKNKRLATVERININPIANNMRRLDLAKRLGMPELEAIYRTSVNYVLENKNVHVHDAQAVYASYPPLTPICWQVAKNMALAIHHKYLSDREQKQYTWVQYAIPNLYDNIKIHLETLKKSEA